MMHRKWSILALAAPALAATALATAACSPAETGGRTWSAPAPARQRCVSRMLVAAPVVRDDGLVYLRGQPDDRQSFLLRFKGNRCPGLGRFSAVAVASQGSRICEGDRVTVTTPPMTLPRASCIIDRLVPFSGAVDAPAPSPQ